MQNSFNAVQHRGSVGPARTKRHSAAVLTSSVHNIIPLPNSCVLSHSLSSNQVTPVIRKHPVRILILTTIIPSDFPSN